MTIQQIHELAASATKADLAADTYLIVDNKSNGAYVSKKVSYAVLEEKLREGITAFEAIYPVGSIYITVNGAVPSGLPGQWTEVGAGACLWGYDGTVKAGTTIQAGLPKTDVATTVSGQTSEAGSHTHTMQVGCGSCTCSKQVSIKNSHDKASWEPNTGSAGQHTHTVSLTAVTSLNTGVFNGASTVQPPAFVVHFFMRIA